MTHPAVADAGVVGFPHDEDGERPLAFVVLKPSCGHVTPEELVAFIDGVTLFCDHELLIRLIGFYIFTYRARD